MKENYAMSVTIRISCDLYEQIDELKWSERMKQSDLLRELVQKGLEAKRNQLTSRPKTCKEMEEMY